MSQWITYVKKYAAANGLTYKQALAEASKTYNKEIKKAGCLDCKKKKIVCKTRDVSESEEESEDSQEYSNEYDDETSEQSISEEESDNESYETDDENSDSSNYSDEDYYASY